MKTLEQVEPRTPISSLPLLVPLTITQPGSYYFTTNLTAATSGIIIAASGVTLNLMGFELVGGIGSGITTDNSTRTNCVVRNGTVRGFSGNGVKLEDYGTVESVRANGNGLSGIEAGFSCSIVDNNCTGNGISTGAGIHTTGERNRIERNHLTGNDVGLMIDDNVNFFAGNIAGNNSPNYDIAAGNIGYAIQAPSTPGAFSGNTGGTAFGTSNPIANYSY